MSRHIAVYENICEPTPPTHTHMHTHTRPVPDLDCYCHGEDRTYFHSIEIFIMTCLDGRGRISSTTTQEVSP